MYSVEERGKVRMRESEALRGRRLARIDLERLRGIRKFGKKMKMGKEREREGEVRDG